MWVYAFMLHAGWSNRLTKTHINPITVYFYGCLVAAALRDPHSPNTPDSGSGGGWMGGMSLVLFVFSALIYWLEPGGGGVQVREMVVYACVCYVEGGDGMKLVTK